MEQSGGQEHFDVGMGSYDYIFLKNRNGLQSYSKD
jgi:hypothetical protein